MREILEQGDARRRAEFVRELRGGGRSIGETVLAEVQRLSVTGRLHALRLLRDHDAEFLASRWQLFLRDRSPIVVSMALDLLAESGGRSEIELLKRERINEPDWLRKKWDRVLRELEHGR